MTSQCSSSRRGGFWAWYNSHRALVWCGAATAAVLYAAYRYTRDEEEVDEDQSGSPTASPPVDSPGSRARGQGTISRLRNTFTNYSAAAATVSETVALVSNDLRTFLASDATELPQSLRQLNKLLQSPEVQETVATVTSSVVRGAGVATSGALGGAAGAATSPPLVDTVIEAVLSERGRGLVGMAVGVATRNATTAVCEFLERRMDAATAGASGSGFGLKEVLDLLSSDQGERLLTLLLTKSIRTTVSSYVESTTGYNFYNDMLASIVNQDNRDALTDLLSRVTASFCRELMISYRRATAANANSSSSPGNGPMAASAAAKYAAATAAAAAAAAAAASQSSASGVVAPSTPCGTASSSAVASACSSPPSGPCVAGEGPADGQIAASTPLALSCVGGNAKGGHHARVFGGAAQKHNAAGGANHSLMARALASPQPPPVWLRQVSAGESRCADGDEARAGALHTAGALRKGTRCTCEHASGVRPHYQLISAAGHSCNYRKFTGGRVEAAVANIRKDAYA